MARHGQWQRGLLWGLVVLGIGWGGVCQAVRFPDGRVAFNIPPYLNDAYTPYPTIYYPDPIYYFVLSLSPQAGESLQRVTISQLANQETIYFVPERTQAWRGKPGNDQFSLSSVTMDQTSQTLTIEFDPPIAPGEVVTLAIQPIRNPALDGVYEFSVRAYPVGGTLAMGQDLGIGRLQFYRGDTR